MEQVPRVHPSATASLLPDCSVPVPHPEPNIRDHPAVWVFTCPARWRTSQPGKETGAMEWIPPGTGAAARSMTAWHAISSLCCFPLSIYVPLVNPSNFRLWHKINSCLEWGDTYLQATPIFHLDPAWHLGLSFFSQGNVRPGEIRTAWNLCVNIDTSELPANKVAASPMRCVLFSLEAGLPDKERILDCSVCGLS